MKVYLDYSATTPVDPQVYKAMRPYFSQIFGNPASLHSYGQAARVAVDQARQKVADFLGAQPQEIIFTSGATESDNLAIMGVIAGFKANNPQLKPHIIISSIEHDAVRQPGRQLEQLGVEVSWLPVNSQGIVEVNSLEKLIKPNTILVSVIYVNSETGARQPLREIGSLLEKINKTREAPGQQAGAHSTKRLPHIYFHTDATQAINYFNCQVDYLHCDLLSFSGHKIYGPKGIGVLYVRSRTPLQPIQLGGHQENNRRSGTLNVPGIVGLAKALELVAKQQEEEVRRIGDLRQHLVDGIMRNIPDVVLNTELSQASPSHAHISIMRAEGESVLLALDLAGIAVSTGSACASSSLEASSTLLAMGISPEVSHYSLRFTLGRWTTLAEIDYVLEQLPPIVERLRHLSANLTI
ncbi:cysteine desulfurase [Patescibacteria group bacterium]|jgi:cysteine desulfurase|nr:cysteine desulfurase [Patescibacteria group bacterium]HPD07728.1 cysteine desulfurase family protein [bacterium]HRT11052.1 cysteine desulfurase family protein [Patescibacteria group bacterium]HRU89751.1 cysteine desulfurase family protein [Patescibacteria group bacterium]